MEYGPPGRKAINFYENGGDTPRKKAARQAFPILIELATDSTCPVITYGELADKIDEYIPDGLKESEGSKGYKALWMSRPLGHIWQTLFEYQRESGMKLCYIPYLTTIVVNKGSNVPTIFKKYLGWSDERIRAEQCKVYQFEHWRHVFTRLREDPRWDEE